MATFLYARVSTLDQNTDLQEKALMGSYPQGTYRQEKKSGTTAKDRDVLNLILDMIDQGGKLVVWKLDRLARNTGDLCQIVNALKSKGAPLRSLTKRLIPAPPPGRHYHIMLALTLLIMIVEIL